MKKYSQEQIASALCLLKQPLSRKEISRRTGIPYSTLQHWKLKFLEGKTRSLTPKQKNEILLLVAQNKTLSEISAILGKHCDAIRLFLKKELSLEEYSKIPSKKNLKIQNLAISYSKNSLSLPKIPINLSNFDHKKGLSLPKKLTPQLAEEIGIHLGDGFLSAKKYDFRVKGHKEDEKEYYAYLRTLYKEVYNVFPVVKEYATSIGFEFYSKGLWEFKTKVLGLPVSPKGNFGLPQILKVNNKEILCAFLRGIFDTDGFVSFVNTNTIKDYPRISLRQKAHRIIEDVYAILVMLGFSPRIYIRKHEAEVVLYGEAQFCHFEKIIGWNNPKHKRRIFLVRGKSNKNI